MSHDRNNSGQRDEADNDGTWPADADRGEVLTDLMRLRELFQSLPSPQPNEDAWTATRMRIANRLRINAKPTRNRKRLATRLGMAAAAALLALLLSRSLWRNAPSPSPPDEEPFPVAEAGDVDIISIDARDVASLVVGEPPVFGELIFAHQEDIHVVECKRCPKCGNVARLEQGEVPMLVTSLARVGSPGQ